MKTELLRRFAFSGMAGLVLLVGAVFSQTPSHAATPGASKALLQQYQELFDLSMSSKKGLTFFVAGQTIGGGVTKVSEETVEIRNQQYGRIVIRLDRIDAVAAN